MRHCGNTHKIINKINYMSAQYYSRDFELDGDPTSNFYGFAELDLTSFDYNFGITIDEVPVTALHYFSTPDKNEFSDDPQEVKLISQGYVYCVILYGIDNCSYLKRFKTYDEMMAYLKSANNSKLKYDDDLMYLNT